MKRGFRSAGGAGREDDERAVRGRPEVRRGVDAGGDASEVEGYRGRVRVASGMDRGDARDGDGARDSVHRGAERVRGEDDIDARLGEAVRELGGWVRGGEGDRRRAHAPHSEHRGDVFRSGVRHHRDRRPAGGAVRGDGDKRVERRVQASARGDHGRARRRQEVAVAVLNDRAVAQSARERHPPGGAVRHRASNHLHGVPLDARLVLTSGAERSRSD